MKQFMICFSLILTLIFNTVIAESSETSPSSLFKKEPSAQEELDSIYAEKNMGYDLAYGYYYSHVFTYFLVDFDKSIVTTLDVHHSKDGKYVSVSPRTISTKSIIGNMETGWHVDETGVIYMLSDEVIEVYSMKTHEKTEELRVWDPENGVKYLRKGLSNESASSALKKLQPKSK